AQCPLQVGQAHRSASEGSRAAQSHALHTAAGPRGTGRERRSLRGDAGRSPGRWGPHREVSQRRLGPALAGWRGNALLHALSRSPPSRAGVHAGASARIPGADGSDLGNVELGEAVEGMRISCRPWGRFLSRRVRLALRPADALRFHISNLSPHVLWIIFHVVLFQEHQKFFFEIALAMMFGLALDIGDGVALLRDSKGEGAIALLPRKFCFKSLVHPTRRRAFYQLHGLR